MIKNENSRGRMFVRRVIDQMSEDKGLAAALRRADNPSTEYQSWGFLISCHVDLEKEWERIPFAAVAAAVARAKPEKDGDVPFMTALANAYPDREDDGPADARLRRLLACTTSAECCRVLRPVFSLVQSKGAKNIDYGGLLDDLLWYEKNQEQIKARWAMNFYHTKAEVTK
jgi:CRISPR system Cascade subunit CasB